MCQIAGKVVQCIRSPVNISYTGRVLCYSVVARPTALAPAKVGTRGSSGGSSTRALCLGLLSHFSASARPQTLSHSTSRFLQKGPQLVATNIAGGTKGSSSRCSSSSSSGIPISSNLEGVNPRKSSKRMANSKYEYVKKYELDDTLLPGCWIVVRIDGKGFTEFSRLHGFEKPNDKRALDLMDACAQEVLREFPDVRLAYGESDEYSFVIAKRTDMYGRRSSKLVSLLVSCFTANYVRLWAQHMGPDTQLQATPMFDGRAVCYPDDATLLDYLAWRQADTHINNQYNTCFWALVKNGKTPAEAQLALKGTQTEQKNELLFKEFGINYAHLPEQFKKGSTVIRARSPVVVKHLPDGTPVVRERSAPVVLHCDIIRPDFWKQHPELLAP